MSPLGPHTPARAGRTIDTCFYQPPRQGDSRDGYGLTPGDRYWEDVDVDMDRLDEIARFNDTTRNRWVP